MKLLFLCLLFVGFVLADESKELKVLSPFIPSISQEFLSNLTPDESKAIENAGLEALRLKAEGKALTDLEETELVQNFSASAYDKTKTYEREFLKILAVLPENVRNALDKVLEEKNSVNFSDLSSNGLKNYIVVVANAFKPLNAEERTILGENFENYGSLLKNVKFQKIMDAATNQMELVDAFIDALIKE